ncbi:MAG: DUF2061 domain-containing protein [Bacteroidota bacterium]
MKEKRYRSILKAICWRLTGTIDTFVISFLITGKFRLAMSISFFEIFTKITLYYLHERLWNRITTGRSAATKPDYEI